jgi:hypothetical protein
MLAAPPAVVVAAVVVEPLVLAAVALAHLPVLALARRAHRVPLRLLARWPVLAKAPLPVPAVRPVVVALAQVPVVAGVVVVPAGRLLNRQWFSAAMARTTP